jgi:hypothetical protein
MPKIVGKTTKTKTKQNIVIFIQLVVSWWCASLVAFCPRVLVLGVLVVFVMFRMFLVCLVLLACLDFILIGLGLYVFAGFIVFVFVGLFCFLSLCVVPVLRLCAVCVVVFSLNGYLFQVVVFVFVFVF